jgi:hypothetical protein
MPRTARVVLGLGAVSLAFSLAACSSSGGGSAKSTAANSPSGTTATSSSETTSSAPTDTTSATTTDYSTLLIAASDIPIPGFQMGTPATPPGGVGTTVAFTGDGGRTLGDTILVLPSADAAKTAAASSVQAAKTTVTGAEVSDAPIGDGGTAIRGSGGSGSVAVLVFSEGKAVVVMEFDSAANDPVPTDVIQQVATAQDGKIKSASLD